MLIGYPTLFSGQSRNMLQSIRDKLESQKWLTYVVLGLLALIFAAWGAYGLVNFNGAGTTYAAEAGGQKIPVEQARTAWLNQQTMYQQRLGREIPPEQKAMLQDQILESLVRDVLLNERSKELGYRVSDAAVMQAIREEPAFQIEGQYSAEVAKERLAQAGITLAAFESELRGREQRNQLLNGIVLSDFQTPTEIQRTRTLQDEQREIRYALFPSDKYSAAIQVDDAAVDAYYKAHLAEYMTAESVKLHYAELRLDQLAAQITVSDDDIKAAYDKNKDRYNEPEKRHGRHILIPVGKDDAAAKKLADEVFTQAKAGKDFAALAKQYSQDPGSADKGGDLGWADRQQFVGPFADALFGMNVGEIRGPVKTQFGYHIIRLDEVQAGKTKPLEAVRAELEAELKKNAAADKFGEIQEKIQQRLETAGADLNAVAKEFNLATGEVSPFLRGAGGAPLGTAQPVQDIVFGDSPLQPARIGGPVMVGEDRLVLVTVTDHKAPQPRPVAEVKDGIVAAIKKDRGSQDALKAAQDAQVKLTSGTSFDDVTKQLGVTAEPAKFIARADSTVPAQLREFVFKAPKPTDKPVYKAISLQTGGAAVVALTQVRTEAPAVDKGKEADQIKQQALLARQEAARHGQGDASAYVEQMRQKAEVRKNPKAFE
jgi:peptidyl-prolyl cis-trans isomerase D